MEFFMSGHYFIIGGAGEPLYPLFNSIAGLIKKPVNVAYLDAADKNAHNFTQKFEDNFHATFTDGVFKRLDLTVDTQNDELEGTLEAANVLYMNGGDEVLLAEIVEFHGLKEHFQSIYNRGGCVGGISAGGIILSDTYVTARNGKITTDRGLKLLGGVAIAAHMDRESEYDARFKLLKESASYDCINSAFGVGRNAAVLFSDKERHEFIKGIESKPAVVFKII
jgi:peptidase E